MFGIGKKNRYFLQAKVTGEFVDRVNRLALLMDMGAGDVFDTAITLLERLQYEDSKGNEFAIVTKKPNIKGE